MLGPDNLELKGCVAIVLCKTETWTRATEPEQDELPSSATGLGFKNRGVPLKRASGTLLVPVQINGAITLDFTVDSGASDVVIPADVFSTLIRTGTIKQSDLIGQQTHILADGSNLQLVTFVIRSLRVKNYVVNNVAGSVAPTRGSLLAW